MKATVTFNDFSDSFTGSYKDNFSYEGKRALFDYLEGYEEEVDTELELDPIAFCCEYSEYKSLADAYREYQDPTDTDVPDEEAMRNYFTDNTTLIEFDGGIIIASF